MSLFTRFFLVFLSLLSLLTQPLAAGHADYPHFPVLLPSAAAEAYARAYSVRPAYVLSEPDGLLRMSDTQSAGAPPAPCAGNPGDLGGTVFQDFDNDGTNDAAETGQAGVVVTVFDCNGGTAGSATTDANGEWTVTGLTQGDTYRVEFSLPADGSLDNLQPGFAGTDNATDVQFVVPGSGNCTVDWGVVNLMLNCAEANLQLGTGCYLSGDPNHPDVVNEPAIISTSAQEGNLVTDGSTLTIINPSANPSQFRFRNSSNGTQSFDLTGEMVLVMDGSGNVNDGCTAISNAAQVNGNIALATFQSGNCATSVMTNMAISAGATALVIIRDDPMDPDNPTNPAGAAGIPVIGVSFNTGQELLAVVNGTNSVRLSSKSVRSLATIGQVGATWGLSESRTGGVLYASSLLKRHAGFGPGGIGAVYQIDLRSGTTSTLYDFGTLAGSGSYASNSSRGLVNAAPGTPTYDTDAFGFAAKAGLGDIDISSDESTLWVMNLANRRLYSISTDNPAAGSAVAMPVIPSIGCSGGTARPWGLKVHDAGDGEKIYVGLICDGATSQNINNVTANVMVYDPATTSWSGPVLTAPLNYTKQPLSAVGSGQDGNWRPWTDSYSTMTSNGYSQSNCGVGGDGYPQPILADIEFDLNGDMILGFLDRGGLQIGNVNYQPQAPYGPGGTNTICYIASGDVLRAGKQSNSSWILEDDGVTSGIGGTRTSNVPAMIEDIIVPQPSGPTGSNGREFYWGDAYVECSTCGNVQHWETSLGGMTVLPASGNLIISAFDASGNGRNAAGFSMLSNINGEQLGGLDVYTAGTANTFSKGVGLGDVEAFCDPIPIQIGNYVWFDTDGDGVQDPCENGIDGVSVSLFDKATTTFTAVTTTANGGQYFFDNIADETEYAIVFGYDHTLTATDGLFSPGTGQFSVGGQMYNLTTTDAAPSIAGPDANDRNDSDASLMTMAGLTGYPMISYTTDGASNHTLDVGLAPSCMLAIGTVTPGACVPTTSQYTLDVELTYSDAPAGEMITITAGGMSQNFTPTMTAGTDVFTLVGLSSDGTTGIDVTASFATTTTCMDLAAAAYNAPMSCMLPPSPACAGNSGDIGGVVFQDFENDGAKAGNPGQSGVVVSVYDCAGNEVAGSPVATNAGGGWTITGLDQTAEYRVEFSLPPALDYLQPGFAGTDNATEVRFVMPGSGNCTVDYGVVDPVTYCPAYVNSETPIGELFYGQRLLGPGIGVITCGTIDNLPMSERYVVGLLDFRNIAVTASRPEINPGVFHHPDWTVDVLGNVFGTDFDATGNMYVTASSHYSNIFGYDLGGTTPQNLAVAIINYGNLGGGPQDLGAAGTVYQLDAKTGEPSVFVQLPQQQFTFTHFSCEDETDPSLTRTTGPGLGNIVYDAAHDQFFVSNFEDGAIYRISATGAILSVFDPQTLANFASDNGSPGWAADAKPYGMAVNPAGNRLFFGTHELNTTPGVYSIDLTASGDFTNTEVFHKTILPDGDIGFLFAIEPGWVAVSDLEFNPDGSLVAALRTGCAGAYPTSHNHGATYYIITDNNANGIFSEAASQIRIRYRNDETSNDDGYGGIGIWDRHDGTYQYVVSSSDMRTEEGPHGLLVFPHDFTNNGNGTTQYFLRPTAAVPYIPSFNINDFKGIGGDVALSSSCPPLPIQIGNYVWAEEGTPDGIQQACEKGLDGVTIKLYDDAGTLVGVDVTADGGQYYFDPSNVDVTGVNPDGTAMTGFTGLTEGEKYFIVIMGDAYDDTTDELTVGTLTYALTGNDTGEGSNPDLNDSDATEMTVPGGVGDMPVIMFVAEETDHTFDVGLVPLCVPPTDLRLVIIPGACTNDAVDDGRIVLMRYTNADRFGVSSIGAAMYNGPDYAAAAPISGTEINLETGIPNAGGIFVVRIFNENNGCFIDTTITVPETACLVDPMGYLYCEETGELITGGTVEITTMNDATFIVTRDGSNGQYQFFSDGTPDVFTITYTPPAGYALSTTRLPATGAGAMGALDPMGGSADNPTSQSPLRVGSTTTDMVILDDFSEAANPYYFKIAFERGDPEVLDNNIPLSGCSVSLGSTVFKDADNNGLQEGTEAGIPNVPVILCLEGGDGSNDGTDDTDLVTGADGILGTADDGFGPDGIDDGGGNDDGQPGRFTDANGDYFFGGLSSGDYFVKVPVAAFAAGAALENCRISSNTSSGTFAGEVDPDGNLDGDDNGVQAGGVGTEVRTGVITLSANVEPTDGVNEGSQGNDQDNTVGNTDDDNGNMTLDLSFFAPVSLGDTVFVDVDRNSLQTVGDLPLAGVSVTLFTAAGTPVTTDVNGDPLPGATPGTVLTNAAGFYEFTNLPPGDYYVVFDFSTAPGAGFYDPVTQNVDGNASEDDDSDAAPNGRSDNTGFLTSGTNYPDLDAGVFCNVEVEAGMVVTICGSKFVLLSDLNPSISPTDVTGFGGTWTTSGSGTFDDTGTMMGDFGTATTYTPSAADALAGEVTLTLTSDNPMDFGSTACGPVSDEVIITILKVDCGTFPWDGQD